ncbi:ankyrin repeat-containing protein [Polaromonas sp. CF318]|uniref:ankyrin repeat domain-containing protein n=1 Tax=Polaromonas sp. CF318 TaxID=1144318 RepID=UPI000271358E|nr:ankyrin repeat domain-containing protein [Polaromonas sp. CF318]EJL82914.1 ankyrin repeat-containing protein [Polaromonas sp. CF318]
MSEVRTIATLCFEDADSSQRWLEAFKLASGDGWDAASQALSALGLRCVQPHAGERIQVERLERFGRRLELRFMELGLDSQTLLNELIELGATHLRASIDDSRTGSVTKLVRIGKAKAKEAEFVAAVAEFDDDFAFLTALEKGKSAEIKRLLAKGISPNQEVRPGVYPIHLAVLHDKKPIVKQLIAAGADVNVQTPDKRIKEDGLRTPLHLAINNKSLDVIEMLVKAGADLTLRNAAGQTSLHYAIVYRHQDACKLLMEHGADPSVLNANGVPALLDLRTHSQEEIPAFLAFADSMGLDLNVKQEDGKNLYWKLGYIKGAVDYLKARGMISSPPSDAYTGDLPRDLYKAIRGHDLAKIKALTKEGFDLDTPYAAFDFCEPEPPILAAASDGHTDVVELLLDAGCNVNATGTDKVTLLHKAASNGSIELVSMLLKRGANPNAIELHESALSQKSDDPMLKALDEGHIAAAETLMPHWLPTQARLEKAKTLLEHHIRHNNKGTDAVNMLMTVEARLAEI